jgi:hypothetical protein
MNNAAQVQLEARQIADVATESKALVAIKKNWPKPIHFGSFFTSVFTLAMTAVVIPYASCCPNKKMQTRFLQHGAPDWQLFFEMPPQHFCSLHCFQTLYLFANETIILGNMLPTTKKTNPRGEA